MEIPQRQLKNAAVVQSHINSANRGWAVAPEDPQKRIKRRGWIGIEERFAQAGSAHYALIKSLLLVPRITKTQFPVPGFEVIAKFAQFTPKPGIKQRVAGCKLKASLTLVVDGAKPHTSSYGHR